MKTINKSSMVFAMLALSALAIWSIPSFAQNDYENREEVVAVGKAGSRFVYKVNGIFVVSSIGDSIGGCVVLRNGSLDCTSSNQGGSRIEQESRPGMVSESLAKKNELLQVQNQQLQAQLTEIEDLRNALASGECAQPFGPVGTQQQQQQQPSGPFIPNQPVQQQPFQDINQPIDQPVAPPSGGDDDLNF